MTDRLLEKLKRRLNITDKEQDELLEDLLEDAEAHFCLLTKEQSVDQQFEFIIVDVAAARYSRKGSEGLARESVDGYTSEYIQNDFEPYMELLDGYFNIKNKEAGFQLL